MAMHNFTVPGLGPSGLLGALEMELVRRFPDIKSIHVQMDPRSLGLKVQIEARDHGIWE